MQFIGKHKYLALPLYFKEDVFIFMFFVTNTRFPWLRINRLQTLKH